MYPRIRNLRNAFHLRQIELAQLLIMSQTGYSKYETGRSEVPIAVLVQLSELYHTSIDYLVGVTDEKEPYPRKK